MQKELCEAAEMDPKRGEDRQAFLLRLAVACANSIPDGVWEGLSREAQNWVNVAGDAANAKKELPEFPDAEKAESAGTTRRRVAAEDKPYEPKLKDDVKVTTKSDKVVTGKIVEMDKEVIVLKTPTGDEKELSRDRIAKIEPLGGGSAKEEEAAPRDPKAGDLVTLTTKRNKMVTGDVVEITDEMVVLMVNGTEEEFMKDRVASIKIDSKPKVESSGSGRRSADKAEDKKEGKAPAQEDDGKRTRSTNAGVSVGTRIRELLIEDMKATSEDISKVLKKEGLEFREATLNINYTEATKFLEMLKKAGKLK
jgi:ribosome maturation factor RimP